MTSQVKGMGIKCPGCGRVKKTLDVFHVRDCTSKQTRLEAYR